MNRLLLAGMFATRLLQHCFFSLVPHRAQMSKGTAVDSGFLGRASGSSMASVRLVRVRNTRSVDHLTYGSISGLVACDWGLIAMTMVRFSSPVPLTMNWSRNTWAQLPRFHAQLVKELLAEETERPCGFLAAEFVGWTHSRCTIARSQSREASHYTIHK